MRLGLIGTGKQGQRYLLEKNGGRHITVSGSRRIPLDDVDGVIIATHPAGHRELALECIAAGKAVLIEKPLALNLADCEAIIDAAEKAGVVCQVAHTYLWSPAWAPEIPDPDMCATAMYAAHERDYSAWLDWAPHVLAMAAQVMPLANAKQLRGAVNVERGGVSGVEAAGDSWAYFSWAKATRETEASVPPMRVMVYAFMSGESANATYDFNRRVYRALFAE